MTLPLDGASFRYTVGHFATGVTVMTTTAGERMHGMTVSAFASVSLEPLLIMVSVERSTVMHELVGRSRAFASPILDRATMEDPILEFLRSQARNYRCRVCGSNHKGSQLRKIGNHNNKLIVQVTCGRCRDSFFLHVEFAGSIVNAVEEVTRVAAPSPRDTDEIDGDPLTHDEVLDAHQRLQAFQGKLTDLLNEGD